MIAQRLANRLKENDYRIVVKNEISNVQWKLSATLSSNSETRQPLDQFEPDDNVPISNEDTAGSVHSQ
uniref:Uncharacterized protein n=1 Tax=Caenorhabditis japonica TaxID=281687 RepID=A0A8R1ESZ8_CAEJA